MSENEVTASEVIEHSQGGENEVHQEISEPGETGAEVQEPVTEQNEVVAEGPSKVERAAFAKQFANLARQERR